MDEAISMDLRIDKFMITRTDGSRDLRTYEFMDLLSHQSVDL